MRGNSGTVTYFFGSARFGSSFESSLETSCGSISTTARAHSIVWAAAVGALLFGVLFLGDCVDGRILAYRDVANYHLPISRVVGPELRAGRLPTWNPYLVCGTPLLANPSHQCPNR